MKTLDNLNPNARHWSRVGLEWADQFWDEQLHLLRVMPDPDRPSPTQQHHTVRNTIWYALGLCMRQQNDDVARAQAAIQAVLSYQYDAPAHVYHGTFKRSPMEPDPPPDHAVEWKDYDPNWREFIGTILIVMLIEYPTLLPDDLQAAMLVAIRQAAAGSFQRRVPPQYTNISLMSAFLLDWAGERFSVPIWQAQADALAKAIDALYTEHGAFWEYNSPTYYGVDAFALALWREYGLNDDVFRTPGAAMEAAFWRDIARFYHAGLKNLCGPWDRSYGMDMQQYIAVVGLSIATLVLPELAPLPDINQPFGHPHDFHFMPPIALLAPQLPAKAQPHFQHFVGERQVEQVIEPGRVATAWLSENVMIGAQAGNVMRSANEQFHLATIHWRLPDSKIGWLRLRCEAPIAARAEPEALLLSGKAGLTMVFDVQAAGLEASKLRADRWQLPGLTLSIEAKGADFILTTGENRVEIQLTASRDFTYRLAL